jgi:hypothetical protein
MSLIPSPAASPAKAARPLPPDSARSCALARDVAGAMLGVPAGAMSRTTRSPQQVCEARHVGMYIAHVVFQLPFRTIAEGFHRHRSTVSYAVRHVEERRDDGRFDELLTQWEAEAEARRHAMAGEPA